MKKQGQTSSKGGGNANSGSVRKSIEVDGKAYMSIAELAKAHGINRTTVHERYKRGLRGQALVANPVMGTNLDDARKMVQVEVNGKTYRSLAELADAHGINRTTLHERYKRGWRGERLIQKRYGRCKE